MPGSQLAIKVDDLRQGYVDILDWVLTDGLTVTPRGLKTQELLGANIVLTDPGDALPQGVGRRLHSAIGAVEAAQLIAGRAYPELMCRVSPHFREFMDGGQFHGSYGPRISGQRQHVVRKLREDPYDRRALITIWDPQLDNEPGLHDYPCTTVLQFMVRNDKLDMQVYMRSNDAWRGLAYDVFQFTQLQHSIARELDREVGIYRHLAASLHVYWTDVDDARALIMAYSSADAPEPDLRPRGLTVRQARQILDGETAIDDHDDSVEWYLEKLSRHLVDG